MIHVIYSECSYDHENTSCRFGTKLDEEFGMKKLNKIKKNRCGSCVIFIYLFSVVHTVTRALPISDICVLYRNYFPVFIRHRVSLMTTSTMCIANYISPSLTKNMPP